MTSNWLGYWNGKLLPQNEIVIRPHDAGFVFGATVTDFCRTYNHHLFRWPEHLRRLRHDCEACHIPLPCSDAEFTHAAEAIVRHNTAQLDANEEIALITAITPGPLGYMVGEGPLTSGTIIMHSFPLPRERYRAMFVPGAVLQMAGKLPADGFDAIKHRNRLHWWMAGRRAQESGVAPVLLDEKTGAMDTAVGAVLCVVDGTVLRSRRGAVLDSISLGVIAELCESLGIAIQQCNLLDRIAQASEVMLTGTAFGVAPVRRMIAGNTTHNYVSPGPVCARLQAAWSELVGVSIVEQMTRESGS